MIPNNNHLSTEILFIAKSWKKLFHMIDMGLPVEVLAVADIQQSIANKTVAIHGAVIQLHD